VFPSYELSYNRLISRKMTNWKHTYSAQKLPEEAELVLVYDAEAGRLITKNATETDKSTCIICLESLEENDGVSGANCKHFYHHSCLTLVDP